MRVLDSFLNLFRKKPLPPKQPVFSPKFLKDQQTAPIPTQQVEDKPHQQANSSSPANQTGTLTPPNANALQGDALNNSPTDLHEAASETLVQPTNQDQEALTRRMAFTTSFFEVESTAKLRIPSNETTDTPSRRGADRFYVCAADSQSGLTIGYGTFFTKEGALISADEELLDLIQFAQYTKDKNGHLVSTPVSLTTKRKKELIKDLLKNMGTTKNPNTERIKAFPYHITQESADALLLHRYKKKKQELNRLIGDNKREPLIEWIATDLHYQGMLKSEKLKQMLKNGQILKSPKGQAYNGYLPVPNLNKEGDPDLRDLGRRIVADYYTAIKTTYPFSPNMTEEERQKHAEQLHQYVAAYAGKVLGSYHSKHMSLGVSRAFIREMATLGSIQIEHDRLGRDLTEKEILAIKQKAKKNCEAYYLSDQPTPKRVAKAKKIATETAKKLAATMKAINNRNLAVNQPNTENKLTKVGQNITSETSTTLIDSNKNQSYAS